MVFVFGNVFRLPIFCGDEPLPSQLRPKRPLRSPATTRRFPRLPTGGRNHGNNPQAPQLLSREGLVEVTWGKGFD